MHPASSVVFFTTASGAGYGMLMLLGVAAALGLVIPDRLFGLVAFAIALTLVTSGLASSMLHLGRPERAWRAFSQWRSSWLSREGVMSVLTYLPVAAFGIGWVILGRADTMMRSAGLATAVCALLTVIATGMIYASLKPIPEWHSRFTVPAYLVYSLMTGAVLLTAISAMFGLETPTIAVLAAVATATGWAWKVATWRHNDAALMPASLNSATGLAGGTVRSIEWPHTEENYVLKEMGYRIARKHGAKLRRIVHIFAFAVPLAALLVAAIASGFLGALAAVLAACSQMAGMLVERWLFFAEARHVVTLYYGRTPTPT